MKSACHLLLFRFREGQRCCSKRGNYFAVGADEKQHKRRLTISAHRCVQYTTMQRHRAPIESTTTALMFCGLYLQQLLLPFPPVCYQEHLYWTHELKYKIKISLLARDLRSVEQSKGKHLANGTYLAAKKAKHQSDITLTLTDKIYSYLPGGS